MRPRYNVKTTPDPDSIIDEQGNPNGELPPTEEPATEVKDEIEPGNKPQQLNLMGKSVGSVEAPHSIPVLGEVVPGQDPDVGENEDKSYPLWLTSNAWKNAHAEFIAFVRNRNSNEHAKAAFNSLGPEAQDYIRLFA